MLSLVFGPFYGLAFMSQRGTQQRVENATRRDAHRRNMQSMESLGLFHRTLTTSRATPFGNLAPTLIPQSLNKTSRNFGFLDSPFYAHISRISFRFLNFARFTSWHFWDLNRKSSLTGIMERSSKEKIFSSIWTFDFLTHGNIASNCREPMSPKSDAQPGVV